MSCSALNSCCDKGHKYSKINFRLELICTVLRYLDSRAWGLDRSTSRTSTCSITTCTTRRRAVQKLRPSPHISFCEKLHGRVAYNVVG